MNKSRHRGYSLIEILVVVTLIGLILSLTSSLVARVAHVHRQMRQTLDRELGLEPMLIELRRDIHRADEAVITDDVLRLTSTQQESVLEYQLTDGRLKRSAINGDTTTTDSAPWPAEARWQIDDGLVRIQSEQQQVKRRFFAAIGIAAARMLSKHVTNPEATAELLPPLEETP